MLNNKCISCGKKRPHTYTTCVREGCENIICMDCISEATNFLSDSCYVPVLCNKCSKKERSEL